MDLTAAGIAFVMILGKIPQGPVSAGIEDGVVVVV
jgi:hypothetical protein